MADSELIRRIYPESADGAHFEVGPWPDAPDCVELRTVDKKSIDYFGQINISMAPDVAKAVGEALIAAAAECSRR
jgi:hypothetical protein